MVCDFFERFPVIKGVFHEIVQALIMLDGIIPDTNVELAAVDRKNAVRDPVILKADVVDSLVK